MSEQKAERIGDEPGSHSAGAAVPPSSDARSEPVAASAPESVQSIEESSSIDSPRLVPERAAGVENPAIEAPKADAPKAHAPKADAPRAAGKVMIMSSGHHNWDRDDDAGAEPETNQGAGMFGKRRLAALAAVVALATVTGALGGALATAGLGRFVGNDATSAGNRTFEATVARIDAETLNLRLSWPSSAKPSKNSAPRRRSRRLLLRRLRRRKPLARLRRRQRRPRHPSSSWRGCRRWKDGYCAAFPTASP